MFFIQIVWFFDKIVHYTLIVMEKTQFFLWLPSNSSMDVFPDNTLTEYRVKLPQPIKLLDDWEVAVTEIQYPHT